MNEDQDLKKIRALLDQGPGSQVVHQWQAALANRQYLLKKRKNTPWLQLAVAASVGFIVGAFAFYQPEHKPEKIISSDDATIEYIYTNNN